MMTYDLCEDSLADGEQLPNRETILSLMIKPFEIPNSPQNRVCGLFALIQQLFSEQHNPHPVMVKRCLKTIDNLLQRSQRTNISLSLPKTFTLQGFVEGMLQRAESERQLPTLCHAAEMFEESFTTLYSLIQERLEQFYLGPDAIDQVNLQQLINHHSSLAQAFHSFRSHFFSFCRLFFQDQLFQLMHLSLEEREEKLSEIFGSLLDDRCECLAVI